MTRLRVHELAKELNLDNKDLLDRLVKLGFQVKNHMSTLTDAAVLKIRQQYAEAKAEHVEEKRIGRAVIRRRKRADEETPATGAEEYAEAPSSVEETGMPVAAAPAEEQPEAAATPAAPRAAVPESIPVPEPAPEMVRPPEKPEAEVQKTPEITPPEAAAPPAGEQAPPKKPEAAPVEPVAAITTPPAVEILPEPEPTSPEQSQAQEGVILEKIVEPDVTQRQAPALEPVEPAARPIKAAGEPAEEAEPKAAEEDESKPRKAKKRRRKKARKDEPARIIKLPDIIPEEPEEEVAIPQHLATKIQVKTEDQEVKEGPRKRRGRPEEFEKDAAERKRRAVGGGARKEVVGREDLYSKKELAAQDDRGRHRGDRDRPALKEVPKAEPAAPKPGKRRVRVDEAITVANLAKQMGIKAGEVIKKLLLLGLPATINQALDFDTASIIASDFDFEAEKVGFEEEEILHVQEDREQDRTTRPPVITVMGHVDHGKTSLLDAIRHTDVTAGEAGGITQHIGAYFVKLETGEVVFLDTPGHEAFTSMRARGAKVTDIVILVVAADDGVMQQTIEAINHAKAAKVPIIVAINKIDKPNANIDRVKRELADQGLISEEWGGNVTMVEISAKKRQGIEELLEMVLLQAELMELKANSNKPARGHVIEAKLDKGRGPVATILIQEGTLKTGDAYVCGVNFGRVRNMFNDRGQRLDEAGPSMPIEVLGLSGVPNAGDDFIALADEKQAKMVAENRLLKMREKELTRTSKVTLESLFEQIQEGEVKELNVIVKTDVHGSQEAISEALMKLATPAVKVNLIHNATGAITETDIMLASASNAIVIGFNVRADSKVSELADQEHVDVRYYDVIYQLLNDIRDAMTGMLEPEYQENVMGRAEVRQTFHVPKIGMIAGCSILDGRIERGAKVRVLRDQVVAYDGKIGSLRRFKDDVKEVKAGFECGIGIENFNDIKVNDILEAYELKEIKPTLATTEGERKAGS
ncbi:MAG: translation initiation factor IF-2 [Syntrophobacteraceae bacterium]|nr:translation initiation factor IF-2 [Desulfobacteraceae bacterium]